MNKHEVKFNNTTTRINRALINLLEIKKFSDITISDICNKAGIHRSTFYAHYDNTVELAADLERSLMIYFYKNNETLTKALSKRDGTLHKVDIHLINTILSEVFEHVKKYRRLFILYDEGLFFKNYEFTQIINDLLVIPTLKANGIKDETLIDYMVDFYITGINAIIRKWVKADCSIPVEEMCEIVQKCLRITLLS